MSMSKGKRFEKNFHDSIDKWNKQIKEEEDFIAATRLKDPGFGFKGVSNPCDFIVYKHPNIFFLELKERVGNRINYKAAISEGQLEQMRELSKGKGVVAGVVFHFSDHEETYFIPIDMIEEAQEEIKSGKNKGKMRDILLVNGEKSLSIEEAPNVGIQLFGEKLRVNFEYKVDDFLRALAVKYGKTK